MTQLNAKEALTYLLPESHTVTKILGAGVERARGKWYNCATCGFVGLFAKNPGEP